MTVVGFIQQNGRHDNSDARRGDKSRAQGPLRSRQCGGSESAHRFASQRDRGWVVSRQRLNEKLVAAGENGREGVRNLPNLKDLVSSIRAEAHGSRPSCKRGGSAVPVDHLRVHPHVLAQRLYEGSGSVSKLSTSALQGKRVIHGPFAEEGTLLFQAAKAKASSVVEKYAPRACEEHSCTEGDAVQENDTADYLNFLSSEFMARFSAAITSRRRESELKRTFEETLKRRLQKQARSDEFFQIYRRAHKIESVAGSYEDYYVLEAAYDIDFDRERRLEFPASGDRMASNSSPSNLLLDNGQYEDIQGATCPPSSASREGVRVETAKAYGTGEGVNTREHRVVDHGSVSAIDVGRGTTNVTDVAATTDAATEIPPRERGNAAEFADEQASGKVGSHEKTGEAAGQASDGRVGVSDHAAHAGGSDTATETHDKQEPHEVCFRDRKGSGGIDTNSGRSKSQKVFADGRCGSETVVECAANSGAVGSGGRSRKVAEHEDDASSMGGTDLTLGRPEPSSVHWKYSRRLIQTRTTPMALTETVVGGVDLSLPHQSLGNTYIELISEVVKDLPGVTRLDLRDNRLTDVGVQEIVRSICNIDGHRGIQILDLSENKLDTVSAQSLCAFLKSKTCCLREILLAKADMDDGETAIVMEAMQHNSTVRYLDFSSNAIGGGYEKTQRMSCGFATGGASIALALDVNSTLQRIDLQWNLLGAKSGVLLGNALANNHTLQWLDVSYNALGEEGAQAIGTALATNDGLVRMDLSYNEISPKGMLVIAQALETNDRLEVLHLNGNSIGFDGGRTLVRSLNYWTLPRTIGLDNCMLESRARAGDCFDPLFPTGKYSLDCSKPYEKAVAYELLRIASLRPGSSIRSLVTRSHRLDKKGEDAIIVQPDGGAGVWKMLGRQQPLQSSQAMGSGEVGEKFRSRHGPTSLFSIMDAVEWRCKLKEVWVVDASTGNRFYPPNTGILEIDFLSQRLPPTGWALINASGMKHLRALADEDEQCKGLPLLYLKMAVKDLIFSTRQVDEIIRTSSKKLNSMQVQELLVALIPRLQDPQCLHGLLEMHLEPKQINAVQRKVGHAFMAFTTCVSGHYSLDLSREIDREAAMRLSERSHLDQLCLRALSGWTVASGGTAQKGKWNSFRNERYRKQPVLRGLTEGFFKMGLTDRVPGVLDFDFVSVARPPADVRPLTPAQFERFVVECGLAPFMTCPGSSPTVGAVATGTASKAAVDEPGESCRSGSGAHVDPTEQNAQEAIGHLAGGVMPSAGSGRGRSNDRHEEDGNKTRNEDGVHHVAAISLGDAVRLKQTTTETGKLEGTAAVATSVACSEIELEEATAARVHDYVNTRDQIGEGDDEKNMNGGTTHLATVSSLSLSTTQGALANTECSRAETDPPTLDTGKHDGSRQTRVGGSDNSEEIRVAEESELAAAAAVKRRDLAGRVARQRLKKAARYAGAGLATALPFVPKASLGESSLQDFLARGGVDWERWPRGKVSVLWRHLLANDCTLVEDSPPMILTHVVKVRIRHDAEDKILECVELGTADDSPWPMSMPRVSRGFFARLVKVRGSRPGQDLRRLATALVLDTFREYISRETDVHLVKRETLETVSGAPLCVGAPSIGQKTVEHILDGYVSNLPEHEFPASAPTVPCAASPTGGADPASTAMDTAASKSGVSAKTASEPNPRKRSVDLNYGPDLRAPGLSSVRDSGIVTAGQVVVASKFKWVAPEVGQVGPQTAVTATSVGWTTAGRDVRFRLSDRWLSCEQARVLASTFPTQFKGGTGNPREDLVVALFGRVADLDNFCTVLQTLEAEAQLSVGNRLGWLNVLNPHHADRHYDLDLRLSDHRRMTRVLAEMAVAEPGANLQNQRFSRHRESGKHAFIPGWEMPVSWPATTSATYGGTAGVPDDGHYVVEYCSDEAMGCRADPDVRERLREAFFLCGVPQEKGLGVFGSMDEGLARTLAKQALL